MNRLLIFLFFSYLSLEASFKSDPYTLQGLGRSPFALFAATAIDHYGKQETTYRPGAAHLDYPNNGRFQ